MAAPRAQYGEAGEGRVDVLIPPLAWVRDAKSGNTPIATYKIAYTERVSRLDREDPGLSPGVLAATPYRCIEPGCASKNGHRGPHRAPDRAPWETAEIATWLPVAEGDTLLCACSRATAAADRCHRVWAARLLAAAGWRVVLDGVVLDGGGTLFDAR